MNQWEKAVLCTGISTGVIFSGALYVPLAHAASIESTVRVVSNAIQDVSVITKVYGDGEKPEYVVLTYPKAIDGTQLTVDEFSIPGQTIEDVETNDKPEAVDVSNTGRYVLLKLAHENTVYDGDLTQKPGREKYEKKNAAQQKDGKASHDAPMYSDRQLPELNLTVLQKKDIQAVDGMIYQAKTEAVASNRVTEPEVSHFQQLTYTDPETGNTIPYNLYLPEGYDSSQKYPLLFFVADASANINTVTTSLFQGNGATSWTDASEQKKHACIVMAPQYTEDLVNQLGSLTRDANVWSPGLTLVTHALENVIEHYAVDTNRIYGTGQSQGGMANIAISDKYPDLFAAQWLVACQWNIDEMKVLKDKNLWITVCEGDTKAFPGMNDAVQRWESLGVKVAKNKIFWDSKEPLEEINVKVRDLTRQKSNINYTVFAGGNHMYTWSFAYDIGAIRDWLFAQTKDGSSLSANVKPHGDGNETLDRALDYYQGRNGVSLDYAKAKEQFELAAAQGNMKASRYLGILYENGFGVKKNLMKAVRYYQKATTAGDITGTYLLGTLYEKGNGVKQDYNESLRLYKLSAQRGDRIAVPGMKAVGNIYEQGLGVKKDQERADIWYARAAKVEAQNEKAENNLKDKIKSVGNEQSTTYSLDFDALKYTKETLEYNGQNVTFRAYKDIAYVSKPVAADTQKMNLYIPEAYFTEKGMVNGYTAPTAPIFLPNGVGGYMPGNIQEPSDHDRMSGGANASLAALSRGYVVAAPAIRGRTTTNASGKYVGKAPALIVDYKAVVRYLRHNQNKLPAGNTEKIISDGTSAGGALSALLGATGNSKDYEPYLKVIGAAEERDDIFGSMVYCPITNLEHADMAYEWVFHGVNEAYQHGGQMQMPIGQPKPLEPMRADPKQMRPDNAPKETAKATAMTEDEQKASMELNTLFPAYVNNLELKDSKGAKLRLNADGTGSFADYIKAVYIASAQSAVDAGKDVSTLDWLTVNHGTVTAMDLSKYAAWATRLKAAPAFDKFDLSSGENDEFGDTSNTPKHFTSYSLNHSMKKAVVADSESIRLLNPMEYIGKKGVTVAPNWRIRHGVKDRDTSLAIPALLALKLQNSGKNVDFASPWGKGHAGDYDLDELFDWTDSICKK